MKIKKYFFLLILLLIFVPIRSEHLFFDMGGVLLKTSKIRAFLKLGLKAVEYPNLRERFFEFLNHIDEEKSDENMATFQGTKLPSFLCKWQEGALTCQQVSDYITEKADKNVDFFRSKAEQDLVKKTAKMLLPENNMSVSRLKKEMIRTAQECKDATDENGNKINTLYLTSNCDELTFEAIRKEFPEIINLFDEDKIIISGKIKLIKPNTKFFEHVLEKFDIQDPSQVTLIDDQDENIAGAAKLKIKGIKHTNTKKTRRELRRIGALPMYMASKKNKLKVKDKQNKNNNKIETIVNK